MDPNANLIAQLRLAKEIIKLYETEPEEPVEKDDELKRLQAIEHKAHELAERVEALDAWIRRGGVMPLRWYRNPG